MLYKISQSKLISMKQKKVLEKQVQELVGENLEHLLGLEKVCYEFFVEGKYIDILAFDRESNAPVIIELKKENDQGLFDQGMEYFNLLSNRKNDFLIKLHEMLDIDANPQKVDWSSSRVIFIGKNFTQRQRRAVDFKGIPIELYDYDWYEDNFFKLEGVRLEKKASLEIGNIIEEKHAVGKIQREFKEYTIENLFKDGWDESRELFNSVRERILSVDEGLIEHAKKHYVGYRIGDMKWNLCVIHPFKSKLLLGLPRVERQDINDPENKTIAVQWEKNGWGKSCDFEIRKPADIDYAMFLIRQVYDKFYKK